MEDFLASNLLKKIKIIDYSYQRRSCIVNNWFLTKGRNNDAKMPFEELSLADSNLSSPKKGRDWERRCFKNRSEGVF